MVYSPAMQLPESAARALEALRRDGRRVRFEIRKACEQERWRLKACYGAAGSAPGAPGEVQLGLLWSDDLAGLEALKHSLEEENP